MSNRIVVSTNTEVARQTLSTAAPMVHIPEEEIEKAKDIELPLLRFQKLNSLKEIYGD